MAAFAYTVLFGWPLVAIWAFKKWPPEFAVLVSIIGGYVLLPLKTMVDLPVLPTFNKDSVPALITLVLVLAANKTLRKDSSFLPKQALARIFLLILVGGTFLTVLTNLEPLFYGPRFVPGMRLYDGFALVLASLVFLIPFFLGHKLLAQPHAQRTFLKFMVIAGLVYSLPALLEVRISPQLHKMFYGVHPHSFAQTFRAGGFRPTVFIGHGLEVALFFSFSCLSALGLWKYGGEEKKKFYLISAAWIFLILILCKSLGPLAITILIACIMLLSKPKFYLLTAAVLAGIVLTYPILRASNLIPTASVVQLAERISTERAASLEFRLINENALLFKANEKPAFGWGSYGRNRIYRADTGEDVSVVDGVWVSTFGLGGWNRYIALFGLICFPTMLAASKHKKLELGPEPAILSMLLAANLIDLIPNASLTPITFLIVGGIWGRLSLQTTAEPDVQSIVTQQTPRTRTQQYTRYAHK